MAFYVKGLWRYPVKTLRGVSIEVAGLTSRRQHLLLGLAGTLGPDDQPQIDGHPWRSDEVLALVRRAAGDDACLEASDSVERFDVLSLLVAVVRPGTIRVGDPVKLVLGRSEA